MERGARRTRHASPCNSKHSREDRGSRRHEDRHSDHNESIHRRGYGIRKRSRSLSPPRESYRKAFSKRDDLIELGKKETTLGYDELKQPSRNEFRVERDDEIRRWPSRPLVNANRDNSIQPSLAMRQSSIYDSRDVGNPNKLRGTHPERQCSSPSYGEEDAHRDNLIQPSLAMRQSSIYDSREVGNPNKLRRTHPERQCSSPSYGEEDAHLHHLLPRKTVRGTLPELFDHREDSDFRPRKGHGLDNYGMLVKKSIVLEDGTVRPFFTLSPNISEPLHKPTSYFAHEIIEGKTGVQYNIENVNSGSPDSVVAGYGEESRYIEEGSAHNLCYSSFSHEEVFGKEGRERNLSRSTICPNRLTQSKSSVLDCEDSRLPRGFSFDRHTNSLQAWQDEFPDGNLYDASTGDKQRHRDTYNQENGAEDPVGSLSTKDLGLYSRRQMDGNGVDAYTGNIKRESFGTTLMSSERYNRMHIGPCVCCYDDSSPREESWQQGSVRSFSDVYETDWMDNTTNLKNHLNELKKDNVLQNDPIDGYRNIRNAEPFISRSGHRSHISRMDISRDVPSRRPPDEYPFGKDVAIVKYRETARYSPLDGAVSLNRSNLNPLSISRSPIREQDIRGLKRKSTDEDDDHRHGLKFQEIDLGENQQKYQVGMPRHYKRSESSFHGKSFHGDSHSRLASLNKSFHLLDHLPESKPQAKITHPLEWTGSNGQPDDNYFYEKEEQDFYHPHKFQKRANEYNAKDRSWSRYHERDQLLDSRDPVKQPDLAEDSEAFKQQVQKAFLRFAKVLNENLAERKRYEVKGKSGSLLCIACGRLSKNYVDTHSLVMHAFNSHKFGLRAEHLGLHKALCVLMSWSYSVVPGNAKVYQSLPASDARAMKEDLVLWPPLVIIHIPRFEKKEDGSQDAISNLEMDGILKGLGFSGGKSNAICHSGGNQCTFIVKFIPTFSGLQVAERLHKYCKENHCGRDDWLQVQFLRQDVGKDTNLLQVEGNAENRGIFYAYIGIAADLKDVDLDTKRRSLVKSRKDIEAIADGSVLIS